MYEKQFGLSRKPFRANATGPDVFVGPQTAKFVAAMKKGLASGDAVVAVTGEPGVGKSTLVSRAINAIPGNRLVIRVSRMQLGHDEVLEFLLEQLNPPELPKSTIKKINLFRDLLAARTSSGTRVIIVIEDAVRIGEDALAELESLTAADNSEGANIVLMGEDSLVDALNQPALRRLKQRTRLRYSVLPLSAGELLAYLKHSFRTAGAEFDLLFEDGAANMLFEISNGNPRVANNLVDSILAAAAEQKASKVDNVVIARVANDEYGVSANIPEPAPEAVVAPEPEPEPAPQPEPEPEPEPVVSAAVPELIQDTLPDLAVLAPELGEPTPVDVPGPEPMASDDEEIPTLFDSGRLPAPDPQPIAIPELSPRPQSEPAAIPETNVEPEPVRVPELNVEPEPEVIADWDRDPTLAELRPDIEALEQAMADFQEPDEAEEEVVLEPVPNVRLKDPTLPSVPEITLDVAIEQKIHEAQEALEKTDGMIPDSAAPEKSVDVEKPEPKVGVPPLVNRPPAEVDEKADTQIEKIARGLAAAKSIDDVDDKMAETLFGEDFSLIAAEFAANAPTPAADDPPAVAEGMPAELELEATNNGPLKEPETEMEQEFKQVYGENALEVSIETNSGGGLDISASQRLATVRALNADKAPVADGTTNAVKQPARTAAPPEPIEDQINTSMTATLKALKARPPSSIISDDDDDDDDDDTKGGFFSRFKRS